MSMSLAVLIERLEIHGSSASRWPEFCREEMQRFLQESPEARAAWEEARQLDALLDTLPKPASSKRFAREILRQLPVRPTRRRRAALRAAWVGLPLAAAATLALWIGHSANVAAPRHAPHAILSTAATEETTTSDAEFWWEMPTDDLLFVAAFDPIYSVPDFECLETPDHCHDLPNNRESSLGNAQRRQT